MKRCSVLGAIVALWAVSAVVSSRLAAQPPNVVEVQKLAELKKK